MARVLVWFTHLARRTQELRAQNSINLNENKCEELFSASPHGSSSPPTTIFMRCRAVSAAQKQKKQFHSAAPDSIYRYRLIVKCVYAGWYVVTVSFFCGSSKFQSLSISAAGAHLHGYRCQFGLGFYRNCCRLESVPLELTNILFEESHGIPSHAHQRRARRLKLSAENAAIRRKVCLSSQEIHLKNAEQKCQAIERIEQKPI